MERAMMRVTIQSVWGEEKKVLARLSEILSERSYREEDCLDLQTAVAEACLNAMEHGNRLEPQLPVGVAIWLRDDEVTVEVYDRGGGPVDEQSGTAEQDRGWGMVLIDQLVDAWTMYCSLENRGFVIQLRKNMRRAQKGEEHGARTHFA
jgi:serine/threonine-protein kinase RsbW